MTNFIYMNGREIGYTKKNITYIDIMSIAVEGKYQSGSNYIQKRCKKLQIKIENSSYIALNDIKNILIQKMNNPHKKYLLLFVEDL